MRYAGSGCPVGPGRAIEGNPGAIGAGVTERSIECELAGCPIHGQHPHPALGCRSRFVHDHDARAVGGEPVRPLTLVEGDGRHRPDVIQVANVEREDTVVGRIRLNPEVPDHDGWYFDSGDGATTRYNPQGSRDAVFTIQALIGGGGGA